MKTLFLSNFYRKQYIVKTRYFCIFMTKILPREKNIWGGGGGGVGVGLGGGVPIRFHNKVVHDMVPQYIKDLF